jgi:DNA-binding Lrp family transcriptional regulator
MKPLFVRIKCELGATFAVATAIMDGIEETSEIYSTSGEYDLLAKFYLSDELSPGRFVAEKLHQVPAIRDTYTIIAFRIFRDDQQNRLADEVIPAGPAKP